MEVTKSSNPTRNGLSGMKISDSGAKGAPGDGSAHGQGGSMHDGSWSARGTGALDQQASAKQSQEEATDAEAKPSLLPVLLPDSKRLWWWKLFTVITALVVGIVEPFRLAFAEDPGVTPYYGFFAWEVYLSTIVFGIDMLLHVFMVAYVEKETGLMVVDWQSIARHYVSPRGGLWWDLVTTLPWDQIAISAAGLEGSDSNLALWLGMLVIFRLGRMLRLLSLFEYVEAHMLLSQMALMMVRNYMLLFFNNHWACCTVYFIARLYGFGEDTWVGRAWHRFDGQPLWIRYVYSFYFMTSVYTGLGDAEFYPAAPAESVFLTGFMMLNLVLAAYLLGTVSMLMVAGDKRSKVFRDRMTNLREFTNNHGVPETLHDVMREHLELHFHSEQASDEHVLKFYPITIKRRVMRHLYIDCLRHCYLFKHAKPKFLDAVLAACHVELFLPSVQILSEGDIVNELLIVVEGEVEASNKLKKKQSSSFSGGASFSGPSVRRGGNNADRMAGVLLQRPARASDSMHGSFGGAGATTPPRADPSVSGRNPSVRGSNGSTVNLLVPASPSMAVLNRFAAHRVSAASADSAPADVMATVNGSVHKRNNSGSLRTGVALSGRAGSDNVDALLSSLQGAEGAVSRSALGALSITGNAERMQAGVLRKLGESTVLGDIAFFAEIPSPESVWSSSVVRVLVMTKTAYEKLWEHHPSEARAMLQALEERMQENYKLQLLIAVDSVPNLDDGMVHHLSAYTLGDRCPSEMPEDTMAHVKGMLTKDERARLEQEEKLHHAAKMHAVQVDQRRVYDFLNAASAGQVDAVKAMLQQGLSPNSCDYDKRTGLMLACHEGHEAVAKLLLESKADPQFKDNFGNTAMYEAVKEGHDDLVDLLLKWGATLGVDGILVSAQMCTCVFEGDLVMLRRILRSGANPDSADYDKRNALHVAASSGNFTAVKVMLEEGGATVDFPDRWGNTALDEAQRVAAMPIVEYLKPLMELAKQGKIKCMANPTAPTYAQLNPPAEEGDWSGNSYGSALPKPAAGASRFKRSSLGSVGSRRSSTTGNSRAGTPLAGASRLGTPLAGASRLGTPLAGISRANVSVNSVDLMLNKSSSKRLAGSASGGLDFMLDEVPQQQGLSRFSKTSITEGGPPSRTVSGRSRNVSFRRHGSSSPRPPSPRPPSPSPPSPTLPRPPSFGHRLIATPQASAAELQRDSLLAAAVLADLGSMPPVVEGTSDNERESGLMMTTLANGVAMGDGQQQVVTGDDILRLIDDLK